MERDINLACGGDCKGDCCKFMLVPLFNSDHALWASQHGFRVFKIKGTENFRMLIEKACNQLSDSCKCMVYATDKRPKMCHDFWCEQMPEYEELFI